MSRPTQHTARRRPYFVALLLLTALILGLVIGACGGGGGETTETGGSPTESAAAPTADTSSGSQPTAALTVPEDTTLEPGARKALIKDLQQGLAELGFDPGPADGIYGPRTTKAVRAFQRSVELEPSGTVNLKTAQALNDALADLRG